MARLYDLYKQEIVPQLMKKFQYKNIMQVPKVDRVILNIGAGEAVQNPKALDGAVNDLTMISRQKPVITRAKNPLPASSCVKAWPLAARSPYAGNECMIFLDKLINLALPRVRDFRGVSPQAFDGRGNYSLGIKEQTIFSGDRL